MKTTVRITVIIPDNYGRIQRLYDDGMYFSLQEEVITGADKLADFIEELKARGGREIDKHEFIDDDDFKQKTCVRYELIC